MSDELKHKLEIRFDLPGGGDVEVTIRSSQPIDEAALILRPSAAVAMAEALMGMARAFNPGDGIKLAQALDEDRRVELMTHRDWCDYRLDAIKGCSVCRPCDCPRDNCEREI